MLKSTGQTQRGTCEVNVALEAELKAKHEVLLVTEAAFQHSHSKGVVAEPEAEPFKEPDDLWADDFERLPKVAEPETKPFTEPDDLWADDFAKLAKVEEPEAEPVEPVNPETVAVSPVPALGPPTNRGESRPETDADLSPAAEAGPPQERPQTPTRAAENKRIKLLTREKVGETQPAFLNRTVNKVRDPQQLGFMIETLSELEELVHAIFEMVEYDHIDDSKQDKSKHARCGETYADLLFAMRLALPQFKDPNNPKPDAFMNFARILLNVTQDTFENIRQEHVDATHDVSVAELQRLIAVVSFIGHLYVRKLISARVVAQVVHDLIGIKDICPKASFVCSVCELMHIIGKSIDSTREGNMLMTQFLARLSNLAAVKAEDSRNPLYKKDIKDAIVGVHEARFNEWPPRAGTQVLLQVWYVPRTDALKEWRKLYKDLALPFTTYEAKATTTLEKVAEAGSTRLQVLDITGFGIGCEVEISFGRTREVKTVTHLPDERMQHGFVHLDSALSYDHKKGTAVTMKSVEPEQPESTKTHQILQFSKDTPDLKVTSVISGRPVCICFSVPYQEWPVSELKVRIYEQTSIHPERLMLFRTVEEQSLRMDDTEPIFDRERHGQLYDGGSPTAHWNESGDPVDVIMEATGMNSTDVLVQREESTQSGKLGL